MTASVVRDFIRKALLELKEHELREALEALAPLIHCELVQGQSRVSNPTLDLAKHFADYHEGDESMY